MSTLFPIPGAFIELAGRFVDPALAFSVGYNYWYLWITNIAGVFFFFLNFFLLLEMFSNS
jgi:amino acid transporter